jgi:hypothetical protein
MAIASNGKRAVLAPGVIAPDDRRMGVIPSTDRLEGMVPTSEPSGEVVTLEAAEDKLKRLRKYLRDYIDLKSEEIDERREAMKYYHDKQWTDAELSVLKDRGQPPIQFNRIKRKINGVIGLLERLRQDPKAYPRTPAHIDGADVATQCVRYGLDAAGWEEQLSEVVLDLSTAGVGGFQMTLEATEDESFDPLQSRVAPETFFYDPRSVQADFSDARFLGVAKWMARDEVLAFLPDRKDMVEETYSALSSGGYAYAEELDPDKEPLWWDGELKKLRIVEVWYRDGAEWKYCIHTGTTILEEGDSPFTDSKGKSTHGFSMTTCNIDEKGIRYGFVRTLKGPQDELNHMHSKATHNAFAKQVTVTDGLVNDIEVIRAEAHKPDGVIALPNGQAGTLKIDNNAEQVIAAGNLMEVAANEIENFGPNTATAMGMGDSNKSGRAIALLQQAAISELGLFIVRVRAMKKRVYTLTWEAVRQYWTTPRFIRITDDEDQVAFLGINQPRMNEWGLQVGTENPIGKVAVDFVLDEGPDTITLREDAQMAIGNALSSSGGALPPRVQLELVRGLIETTNLPPSMLKRMREAFDAEMQPQQPDPLAMRGAAAEVAETEASAAEKAAKAQRTQVETQAAVEQNAARRLLTQIAATGGAPQLALPL